MNFQELVAAHRDGRTNPQLAQDCGDVFSDKRMQQLATGAFKEFPEPKTIIALAKGLRVSQRAVLMSLAESLKLSVASSLPPVLEMLPASVSDLSDDQIRAIARLIYEFTEGAKKKEGTDSGTSAKKSAEELEAEQLDAQDYNPDVDAPTRPEDPEESP